MKKSILVDSEYACSGCGACTSVCANNAIHLEIDDAGFYAAQVDLEKCIDCGLCQKVCTRYDKKIEGSNLYNVPLYALQSKNPATVKKSSSGGLAHELSEWAIGHGEKVIGVVYDIETNRAEHRIADDLEKLSAFDGSKYIQSSPEAAFRDAIESARKDKTVKYTVFGTPCQIAGLVKVCEQFHIRNQFLLIEIFCHGVPSYKVWDKQYEKIISKLGVNKVDNVQFRYKKVDWHSYCLKVDAGDKTFYGSRERELFWQVFFENILLGDSCYKCRMRKAESMADIRLGDYWGQKFQERRDGVSAVFTCTKRGQAVIEELAQNHVIKQLDATSAKEMLAAQNMSGYHQQKLHDEAMNVLRRTGNVVAAIRLYRSKLSYKQKLKRTMLLISSLIPDHMRSNLRKRNSSRQLNRNIRNE